jgi:hypothetical protein
LVPGSGAGHAIEDAYILGLVLRDYFAAAATAAAVNPLKSYTALYQAVRRPRAQKAQLTSREAGDVYEMQGPEFAGIELYEDCLPIVREKLKSRMKWVWGHDLEADYVEARREAGLEPSSAEAAMESSVTAATKGEVEEEEVKVDGINKACAVDEVADHHFTMSGMMRNGEVRSTLNGTNKGEVKHARGHGHGQGISVMEVEA